MSNNFWKNKKVLVTGGAGFCGSHLVELLVTSGADVKVVDSFENGTKDNLLNVINEIELIEGNLLDYKTCKKVTNNQDIVMHLAAKVGGVGYNVKHPATMFYHNVMMNTQMLEASKIDYVERYLCVSSACVYPRYCSIPTPEEEGFKESPEPTNFGYGWSKRIAELQAQAYHDEYGMKISIVRPYNMYGPRDHFNLELAHVIPALINKVISGMNPVVVWGDGEQTRAFVYVEDVARGMMLAIEKYPKPDPINIGTDEEIKIKDLIKLIVKLSGKNPEVIFDTKKPGGQPRRNANISKAKKLLDYHPIITLEHGLMKTIDYYRNSLK